MIFRDFWVFGVSSCVIEGFKVFLGVLSWVIVGNLGIFGGVLGFPGCFWLFWALCVASGFSGCWDLYFGCPGWVFPGFCLRDFVVV